MAEPIKSNLPIAEKPPVVIQKSVTPLSASRRPNGMSIKAFVSKEEEVEEVSPIQYEDDNLPSEHFSQNDIDREWTLFIKQLIKTNSVAYNAINNFKLLKTNEDVIEVNYASSTAKAEFDKLSGEFFNHFKHKVKNLKIKVEFKKDQALQKEVMTKRKLFEKFAEINPILKDLDGLMRFDLS